MVILEYYEKLHHTKENRVNLEDQNENYSMLKVKALKCLYF